MRTDISEDPKGDPTKNVPAGPAIEDRDDDEVSPLIAEPRPDRDHPLGEGGQRRQTGSDRAGAVREGADRDADED